MLPALYEIQCIQCYTARELGASGIVSGLTRPFWLLIFDCCCTSQPRASIILSFLQAASALDADATHAAGVVPWAGIAEICAPHNGRHTRPTPAEAAVFCHNQDLHLAASPAGRSPPVSTVSCDARHPATLWAVSWRSAGTQHICVCFCQRLAATELVVVCGKAKSGL